MGCDVSGEQLWSWIDRDAPELEEHLANCSHCRERARTMREEIGLFASESESDYTVPESIGPYTIIRLIGEGGQALVFEAEQPDPRRRVAVKVLKGGSILGSTRLKHFRRETHALAHLNHPGIATIYEAGRTDDGLYYFAMEYVDGIPLHSFVTTRKPELHDILRMFLKLCDAVGYAHFKGIVHRDLKPSNILIDTEGEIKILDFGLARALESEPAWSMTTTIDGKIVGTPRYMSPEQAMGAGSKVDQRSDVYALGVILYEILAGKPPHRIQSLTPDVIRTLRSEVPSRPSKINSSVHQKLDAIVLKALEKDLEKRYQSVEDLANDIQSYLKGETIEAKTPSVLFYLRRNIPGRKVFYTFTVVTALLIVVAILQPKKEAADLLNARLDMLLLKQRLYEHPSSQIDYYRAMQVNNRYPDLPEAVLVRAHAYVINQYRHSARNLLMASLQKYPECWMYKVMLEELRREGIAVADSYPSISYWNDSRALSPDAWYLRAFATLDLHQGIRWLEEALQMAPRHLPSLVSHLYLTAQVGELEKALETNYRIIGLKSESKRWQYFLITLLMRMDRSEDAVAACDSLLMNHPSEWTGLDCKAKILRQHGQYHISDSLFTEAIDMRGGPLPETAWTYFHRGTVRRISGNIEGAIEDYATASRFLMEPSFATARLYIFMREIGRHAEAAKIIAEAMRRTPDNSWLHTIYAVLSGHEAPERLIRTANTSNDIIRRCEAMYYTGEYYLLQGNETEAVRWFQKCRETNLVRDPTNALESISEYELAGLRLSELSMARSVD